MPASYRCAEASDQRTEPMLATASQVRGWVLVEVRGAWGEDAIHCSALAEHVPADWKDQLKRRNVRVICIRSHLRTQAPDVRLYACGVRRPGRGAAPLWTRDVRSLADVVAAMDDLRLHRLHRDEAEGWRRAEQRIILVCTNGRHDQCCANRGRPVIRALRETRWADHVWECSHIGGDRFAGNVLVLPRGLYYGRVDPDDALALADATAEGRVSLEHLRGRSDLAMPVQAAEIDVRRRLGLTGLDDVRTTSARTDGDLTVVTLEAAGRDRRVRVRRVLEGAHRLTCGAQRDSPAPTYVVEPQD